MMFDSSGTSRGCRISNRLLWKVGALISLARSGLDSVLWAVVSGGWSLTEWDGCVDLG